METIKTFVVLFLYLLLGCNARVNIILDTDMDFDVDDVGALCAAHGLVQLGEAEILAVVHNVGYPRAIGAVSVINHFYGRDDIRLGAFKGNFGASSSGPYIDHLLDSFDSPIRNYSQVEDAVTVLRKSLAEAEDSSVVIVSVGFLQNIAALLESSRDNISHKSGSDLLREKVSSIYVMGGYYPQSDLFSEFNFNCGWSFMGEPLECEGSARDAVSGMPSEVRMVFSGFEVGFAVNSGGALTSCATSDNPCRQAYVDYVGEGKDRSSWDPLTLVAAVRGASGIGCEEVGHNGINEVDFTGNNFWIDEVEGGSNQTYLLLKDAETAGNVIDELICILPDTV